MTTEDGRRSGRPKEVVTDENIKKVHKIILNDRRTINSDYYIALLDRLKEEITEKTAAFEEKKVLIHRDIAPCHKSVKTMTKIHELDFELLLHPPYFPDMAASDYFPFSDLKRMLSVNTFSSNEDVIEETEA
ncbi:hypothetical protein GWI33_017665 [Rhynchophorus ferrugineus]|uniref:Uncharacterized protein n=1 Tax=Rhynchophorus ferrugineus TaxID=354439 RepID=A0A834HVJ4_RHYFE|nr:hypothetical protein GWI33_017665 [Rhynchophorus ferrugineus]